MRDCDRNIEIRSLRFLDQVGQLLRSEAAPPVELGWCAGRCARSRFVGVRNLEREFRPFSDEASGEHGRQTQSDRYGNNPAESTACRVFCARLKRRGHRLTRVLMS